MSPLFRLYTPSPFIAECGSCPAAPFHHSESSLNSKLPLSAWTCAAGGRNGKASMFNAAIRTYLVLNAGSAHRTNGTLAFTRSSVTTF